MSSRSKRFTRSSDGGGGVAVQVDTSRITLPQCVEMLEVLKNSAWSDVFGDPVDEEVYDDYRDTVTEPMCYSLVQENLSREDYSAEQFVRHVRLIYDNCQRYNQRGTPIWHAAQKLRTQFEEMAARVAQGGDAAPPPQMSRSGRVLSSNINYAESSMLGDLDDILGDEYEEAEGKRQKLEEEDEENEGKRVEKLLTVRQGATEKEFLVKWQGLSYLHTEWVPRSQLGPKTKHKLRRFESDAASDSSVEKLDDAPFDPRYLEVDRIIDYTVDEEGTEWYMVKWCELDYAESTWEVPEALNDDAAIERFRAWNVVPERAPPRPEPDTYQAYEKSPVYCNDNELRSYQVEGVNWLVFNWYQRRGSILADEMGLGKTVQAVTFLDHLKRVEGVHGPFMLACNLSTLDHWAREFERWTNMNVVRYYGSKLDRAVIREHEFHYHGPTGNPVAPYQWRFDVLLTTYDMLTATDWEELRSVRWACVAVDEAQRMKGHSSKFRDNMMSMIADHRVLLTGTPIQNNTTELWALLNFVSPRDFPDMEEFQDKFLTLETADQVNELHELLRPYLLRRMKEDVEKSIPPKEETIVQVELTVVQKQYYRAILEGNRGFLNRGCAGGNVPHLLNVAVQLRKVCNHPFLLKGVEDKQIAALGPTHTDEQYLHEFIYTSGKMVLLDKLLPQLRAEGHRVLIFSQMVRVLDLLETYLSFRQYGFERIDGSVRGNDRQAAIDRFSKPDSPTFAFLLCTRAGGVGINLTAADTVIIFDSDWNPQNDVQAQARCHRIGQQNAVKVYRLITRDTYEREMFERSSKKLGLDQAVLHNMGNQVDGVALDERDMEELLRYGAYNLFKGDEQEQEERSRRFCEADINQILQGSAETIRYDPASKSEVGSSFAQATFVANSSDRELDMHADNFWQQVLGQQKDAAFLLSELLEGRATGSPETREAFLMDLQGLVEVAEAIWESGRAGDLPEDLHLLAKLLVSVQETPDFSSAQRAEAAAWYARVVTPSRRSRTGHDEDEEFQGEVRRATPRTPSAPVIPSVNGKWSRYERSRLQKLIVNSARPRWQDFKVQAELDGRSDAEIKAYVLAFIHQCVRHARDDDARTAVKQMLLAFDEEALTKHRDAPVDVSLLDSRYVDFIRSKVATWGRRIHILRRVHHLMSLRPTPEAPLPLAPLNKTPARWWNSETDWVLLEAAAERGIDADPINEIVADETLPFAAHQPPVPEPQPKVQEGPKKRGRKPKKKPTKRVETHRRLQVEFHGAHLLGGKVVMAQNVIKEGECRKDGLIWEPYLPSTALFQRRVEFLIDRVDNYGMSEDLVSVKASLKRQLVEEREAQGDPTQRRSPTWSERERTAFVRALLVHGEGDWDAVREEGDLFKDSEQIERYYRAFLLRCSEVEEEHKDRMDEGDEGDRQREADLGHVPDLAHDYDSTDELSVPEVLPMDVVFDEADSDEDEEKFEEISARRRKFRKDAKSRRQADINKLRDIVDHVDLALVGLVKTRLRLFHSLRERVLTHRRLQARLSNAVLTPEVPVWWVAGQHDLLLLRGVDRLGVASDAWTRLAWSKECPFYALVPGADVPLLRRDLLLFVHDPARVCARLQYTRLLVTNPRELQSMGLFQASSRPSNMRFENMPAFPSDEQELALPLRTSQGAVVHSVGTLSPLDTFHSNSYVWPVGFLSKRLLPGGEQDPDVQQQLYVATIEDDGSGKPLFRVQPAVNPSGTSWTHRSATGVWQAVLAATSLEPPQHVDGPVQYGLADAAVVAHLKELPGAEKYSKQL